MGVEKSAPVIDEERTRVCVRCGYDLRGLPKARCPECGLPFDPDGPPPANVPWMQRREIGTIIAYFRTAKMVVLRPRQFAEQAWQWSQVDPSDGEMFRRITIAIATLSTIISIFSFEMKEFAAGPAEEGKGLVIATGCVLVFLLIATLRVPIPMPHASAEIEKRFAALQKFCCAGLAFTPIVPVLAVLCVTAQALRANVLVNLLGLAMGASIIMIFMAWCGGCAMYLIFAGRVRLWMLIRAVIFSIGLWAFAFFASIVTELVLAGVLGARM